MRIQCNRTENSHFASTLRLRVDGEMQQTEFDWHSSRWIALNVMPCCIRWTSTQRCGISEIATVDYQMRLNAHCTAEKRSTTKWANGEIIMNALAEWLKNIFVLDFLTVRFATISFYFQNWRKGGGVNFNLDESNFFLQQNTNFCMGLFCFEN